MQKKIEQKVFEIAKNNSINNDKPYKYDIKKIIGILQ